MSSWGRWFPSPFAGRGEPESSNSTYHPQERQYQTQIHEPRQPSRPHRDDDVLIFRYKNTNYPVKFPAYSISDRRLTIGYAREKASEKLGLEDPDMLRMIYKGKKLDNDDEMFCDHGFTSEKPAEIFCTVSGVPINRPQASEEAGDEDDDDDEDGANEQQQPGKKRKNKKKKKKGANKSSPATASSSTPYPTAGVEFLPMPSNLHPSNRPSPNSTNPSSANPSRPSSAPPPLTPLAKLDAIASAFHTTLVPQCVQYITSPPADETKRKFEHKKLTETILTTVMIKLDGVETEGDEAARMRRKELVREAQGMMNRLDEVAGEKAG